MTNPDTEDQLRIISLTSYLSKVMETYVVQWLMKYVGDKMDWGQYGGEKGSSISHYLVEFVNFILYNQDMNIPHAVLALLVDYSKAFNRICHNRIVTILSRMGVPGWLLKIVMGFLTERELIVRYLGKQSGRKWLPGGSPQGTRLGLFLFLILINFAGYEELNRKLGEQITTIKNKRTNIPNIHLKFVDDLTLAESFNLRDYVIPNPDPCPPRPLSYHNRTLHVVPPGNTPVQAELHRMVQYCEMNKMKINSEKTKVVLFNTARNFDFMPRLSMDGNTDLEVVEEFRLLGIHFQTNMSWQTNTDNICKNGYARIWMLRRLKRLGANHSDLLDVYCKQIRCVLELAVVVWTPGLTKLESSQIERVQKCALHVILGQSYESYDEATRILGLEKLHERRLKLCLSFAKRCEKSPKYSTWFRLSESPPPTNIQTRATRNNQRTKYMTVPARTDRYDKSPLPFMTKLLNEYYAKKK